MFAGGSYALAVGTLLTLTPPDTHIDAVLLTNSTPMGCTVSIDGSVNNLPAWTADTFAFAEGNQVAILPGPAIAGASLDDTLTVTWVLDNEIVPGGYPQTLTAQAIAAEIAGTVTTTPAESLASTSFYVPSGTAGANHYQGIVENSGTGLMVFTLETIVITAVMGTALSPLVTAQLNLELVFSVVNSFVPLPGMAAMATTYLVASQSAGAVKDFILPCNFQCPLGVNAPGNPTGHELELGVWASIDTNSGSTAAYYTATGECIGTIVTP